MLEGVLKVSDMVMFSGCCRVSILGMLEGVLKGVVTGLPEELVKQFQSLVCWRGC